MIIHRIRVAGFRGITAREVEFAERGVTVVQGPNEAGKSSLAEALDLLLEYYDSSSAAAVKATKPVDADVGTEIEAELSAGPYRFTYTKRFHKDRATTLTVQAPAPEQLTGREAHDRVQEILSASVDLVLWRALRVSQGQSVAQPELADAASLAGALDVAAEGAHGGEREQTVLARAQREYERYFTRTGQENTAFKTVRAELEQAAAELAAALAALQALEHDSERCGELAREIDAAQPELQRQHDRVKELDERWQDVQRELHELERLQLHAAQAENGLRAAEQAVQSRIDLATRVDSARRHADELAQQQAVDAPQLQAVEQEARDAQEELASLRAQLTEARARQRRAQEAVERSRDAFSLELLEERLQRVGDARAAADAARTILDGPPIDAGAVARIEEAQLALARSQAGLAQQAPRLTLHAREDAALLLDGEDLPLAAGASQDVDLTEPRTLRIGPIDATITPGEGLESVQQRVNAAQRELDDACAAWAVADLAEARSRLRQREEAQRSLAEAERSLAENLRDLSPDALRHKVRQLRARVADADGPADVDAAKQAVEHADEAVRDLEHAVERAERRAGELAEQRTALKDAFTTVSVRLESATQELATADSELAAARTAQDDDALEAAQRSAQEAVAAAAAQVADAETLVRQRDPDSLQAELENARAVLDKQSQSLRESEVELVALRARLNALGESGAHDRVDRARTRVDRAQSAWRQASRGAAAAKLLYDTLLHHREQARRAYRAPLRDKINGLGRIVFGADFSVELDDDLSVARRTLNGVTLDVAQLSTGAQEQLSVLCRLAAAAITSADGGVPLLLDDALGWSDPSRLEKMGAAFRVAAQDAQVIVLTCVPDRYAHIGSAHTVSL